MYQRREAARQVNRLDALRVRFGGGQCVAVPAVPGYFRDGRSDTTERARPAAGTGFSCARICASVSLYQQTNYRLYLVAVKLPSLQQINIVFFYL